MSVNKEKPHLVVIPEDEANRMMANGFRLELPEGANMQVMPESGGWTHVVDDFCNAEVPRMRRYPGRFVVLLLDFDGKEDRFEAIQGRIPAELSERVFLIGARTTPERLKAACGKSLEAIGVTLGAECRSRNWALWAHQQLSNNEQELARMARTLRPILF